MKKNQILCPSINISNFFGIHIYKWEEKIRINFCSIEQKIEYLFLFKNIKEMSDLVENILKLSEYELVFYLENLTDKQLGLTCSLNKKLFDLCYNSVQTERIFKTRSEKYIDQEIIDLKKPQMSWKEFYIRVYKFKNKPLHVNEYCRNGELLELKIYINMDPRVLPSRYALDMAADGGHLELFKYLKSINILPTQMAADWAAAGGHLELLKYLKSINISPTQVAGDYAAERGHLDVVKYLESLDILPAVDGLVGAAAGGHLEMLKYLVSRNFLPVQYCADIAAAYNHFNILEYLGTLNPPILPTFVGANYAAENGHLEMLKYLATLDPPILPTQEGANLAKESENPGTLEVLEYLASLDPPILPN